MQRINKFCSEHAACCVRRLWEWHGWLLRCLCRNLNAVHLKLTQARVFGASLILELAQFRGHTYVTCGRAAALQGPCGGIEFHSYQCHWQWIHHYQCHWQSAYTCHGVPVSMRHAACCCADEVAGLAVEVFLCNSPTFFTIIARLGSAHASLHQQHKVLAWPQQRSSSSSADSKHQQHCVSSHSPHACTYPAGSSMGCWPACHMDYP